MSDTSEIKESDVEARNAIMMSMVGDVIRKSVDRILCLTCPQSLDKRYPSLREEFSRFGLSDILVPIVNVHSEMEHYGIRDRVYANEGAKYTNVKNCTLGHYHMAKLAKDAGYSSVMIVEDDCRFCKDTRSLLGYMSSLGRGRNSVLSYVGIPRRVLDENKADWGGGHWSRVPGGRNFDLCTCYTLGKDGIDELVSFYEKCGTPGYAAPFDACDRTWQYLAKVVDLYVPDIQLFVPSGDVSVTGGAPV